MKYQKREEIIENEQYTLATARRRAAAICLDFVFILLLIIVLFLIIIYIFNIKEKSFSIDNTHISLSDKNIPKYVLICINGFLSLLPTIYFAISLYIFNGFTLGKRLMGIRVVSLYHHKLSLWHSIERSLGYIASTLEFGLGFFQVLWTHNRMATHDRIAETIVVRLPSSNN